MKSTEIRKTFLDYFASHGHQIIASSSLIPHEDPTLLFANAGMNQFKDVFLGLEKRSYVRAATAQKCVRAGGKHNDLENVGYTARHHTFFEMLGNFSFGDYFKQEAINFAWELLTKVYKLPADKLWVTVYENDQEAYQIWTKHIGIPTHRCVRIGDNKGMPYASDNFWMMGETGPCGPCTEIFYDHGPTISGGPPGSPDQEGDRYVEIWNNVFMQFNRDESGLMLPLPKPSVDTGMGLERMAAVLQGVHSNYDIDLMQRLIRASARITQCANIDSPSLKVLADHIRAAAFLIADGVLPNNEGRGYVLRRIIRRAIRHGWKIGVRQPFFHQLTPDLVDEMGAAYPELAAHANIIDMTIRLEEEQFFTTITNGMAILDAKLSNLDKTLDKLVDEAIVLDGETAFRLHDTFGFPLDLTADICRERGIKVDTDAFDIAMQQQKNQARAAGQFQNQSQLSYEGPSSEFTGYAELSGPSKILALYRSGAPSTVLRTGEEGVVVIDRTPFYAQAGGQVGDRGILRSAGGCFLVKDTQKISGGAYGLYGNVQSGTLQLGMKLDAEVDEENRNRIKRNHSATHLLHKALRTVLGDHVQQKGSLVNAEKTRFDFTHHGAITTAEIAHIEVLVNSQIIENSKAIVELMPIAAAQKSGAVMLFGEKYGAEVRVLTIGNSQELCGGTHIDRTGEIGFFKIISEMGIASGIRRIEAVTGVGALAYVQDRCFELSAITDLLHTSGENALQRVAQLMEDTKAQEKALARIDAQLTFARVQALLGEAVTIRGVKVLAVTLENISAKSLRDSLGSLILQLKPAVIVLASHDGQKAFWVTGVSSEITNKYSAVELANYLATQLGGKSGGRANIAQGSGTEMRKLPQALASVALWVENNPS